MKVNFKYKNPLQKHNNKTQYNTLPKNKKQLELKTLKQQNYIEYSTQKQTKQNI